MFQAILYHLKKNHQKKVSINLSTENEKPISNNGENEHELLLPFKYIRDDEKDKIHFSQNGILEFINELINETKNSEWKKLYNKDNLVLEYKNGSILSKEFILGKTYYVMPKSLFKNQELSYEFLAKMMYDPEIRKSYDSSFKEYSIHEISDNYSVFRIHLPSPFFLVSERDFVDKRVWFIADNCYYNLATSIDNFYPQVNDIVRCKTYINYLKLSQDENNYYFDCLAQYDAKSIIPEKLLNFTIPNKTLEWFKNFIQMVQKIIESEVI